MDSHFEAFSEDEILAINEAVVQTNTKKARLVGVYWWVEIYFHAHPPLFTSPSGDSCILFLIR